MQSCTIYNVYIVDIKSAGNKIGEHVQEQMFFGLWASSIIICAETLQIDSELQKNTPKSAPVQNISRNRRFWLRWPFGFSWLSAWGEKRRCAVLIRREHGSTRRWCSRLYRAVAPPSVWSWGALSDPQRLTEVNVTGAEDRERMKLSGRYPSGSRCHGEKP